MRPKLNLAPYRALHRRDRPRLGFEFPGSHSSVQDKGFLKKSALNQHDPRMGVML
ncbi:hypothetical protein Mgrana_00830 [Meiothermus granaticius NBRC 107808]|uniref:Uncharacterized protein n=1 Tax=Meiothermus granaticius NBRC 107808 TaxID=1227551 RepID=A0A399FAR6_9DEIN|nr:hypothetical protein Mgrana_00830 [Meiothermus granaticius NBRC 107808]